MLLETMDYSSLEEAYGSAFQQRVPITHESRRKEVKAVAPFNAPEQRTVDTINRNRETVDSVMNSLPLDRSSTTENFTPSPPKHEFRRPNTLNVREQFTASPGVQPFTGDRETSEKLARILRLVEQNRTGYEQPAIQDMLLYVATGVFFLFTFDTFVMLGRNMYRHP
jgi:hypothetical protein